MFKYFDLNRRAHKAWGRAAIPLVILEKSTTMASDLEKIATKMEKTPVVRDSSGLVREAARFLKEEAAVREEAAAPAQFSVAHQVLMYVGIFIGVLLSTALAEFKSEGVINLSMTAGKVIISALIALIVVPQVYEKVNVNPGTPLLVQLGLFVQNGVFWSVVIDLISETL